jgi:RNA polymerase sigma-70 factor (ECF subfamily)
MAAIAHQLGAPLANNPHWNEAQGAGQGTSPQPLTRNRLDPDLNLVERCLAGDEAAWEALVRTHTRRVYGFCYRFTGKDSEAQDLTQEVFLRVFRSLKSYRSDDGAFATWLARLSRNLLIDHYRRTRKDRSTESIEEQLPMIEERAATSARPEGLLAGREASEMLQAALQRLSPDLREAVILRDLQELEYREIADVLKIPEGTVKSRLNRGRAELARVLRQQRVVL